MVMKNYLKHLFGIKNYKKKGLSNVPPEQLKVLTTQRIEENKNELEKLKKTKIRT